MKSSLNGKLLFFSILEMKITLNGIGVIRHLKNHFPGIYSLYLILKDQSNPPTDEEKAITAGKQMLNPSKATKYLDQINWGLDEDQKQSNISWLLVRCGCLCLCHQSISSLLTHFPLAGSSLTWSVLPLLHKGLLIFITPSSLFVDGSWNQYIAQLLWAIGCEGLIPLNRGWKPLKTHRVTSCSWSSSLGTTNTHALLLLLS